MTTEYAIRAQRAWARVAGLMYWLVLLVDLTGMQLHSPTVGRALMLAGSVLTVPLALGLFFALRPVNRFLSGTALACRLLEAALGAVSTLAGFAAMHTRLAESTAGATMLRLAGWDDRTSFAAFSFTIGSMIFFYLFVRSGYIPSLLAWWGLFASVVAMAACLLHLVRPAFSAMTMLPWMPALLAETSTGVWLLFRSVNVADTRPAAPPGQHVAAVVTS